MQRRDFIYQSCKACLALGLAGTLAIELSGCGSAFPVYKTTINDKKFTVPVSQFIPGQNFLIVRDYDMEYDVLLVKNNDSYHAYYLQCTHQNQPLTVNDKNIKCSSHGSVFGFDGNVLKGPADKALRQFTTQSDNNNIFIHFN